MLICLFLQPCSNLSNVEYNFSMIKVKVAWCRWLTNLKQRRIGHKCCVELENSSSKWYNQGPAAPTKKKQDNFEQLYA